MLYPAAMAGLAKNAATTSENLNERTAIIAAMVSPGRTGDRGILSR
jgi:hypothetical protein